AAPSGASPESIRPPRCRAMDSGLTLRVPRNDEASPFRPPELPPRPGRYGPRGGRPAASIRVFLLAKCSRTPATFRSNARHPRRDMSPARRSRRAKITNPIFSWARGVLPAMSDTEREALEAGDVWWDADLFTGNPDWLKLLKVPQATLTAEEQAFLNGPV